MGELEAVHGGRKIDLANWTRPTPLNQPQAAGSMGPGEPLLPAEAEEAPRLFEYQSGINLVMMPRSGFGMAPFSVLRALSESSKEIRLNIELIKRTVRGLKWGIVPSKEKDPLAAQYEAEIDRLEEWLETPDRVNDFDQWVGQLVEELLVTDAVTIWQERSRGGEVTALELVDGTTIRPVLDFRGRVATPPMPAYIQVLHGMPTSWFTREQLIYSPLNSSTHSPYGTSPIEFILLVVNLALRRDAFQVGYYTSGNVPEALVGAPSDWTKDQVDTWQRYWDAMVAGNVDAQRRMHFIPLEGGRGSMPVYEFKRDDPNQVERDKWLMQVACWAFGNSPSEFGLTPGEGLGGSGFAGAMENAHYRSMVGPVTEYIARRINGVLKGMGKGHLRFAWDGMDPQEDKLQQAQVDQIYVPLGIYGPGYVQDRLGVPPEHRPVEERAGRGEEVEPAPGVMPVGLPEWYQRAAGGETLPGEFFRERYP